MEKIKYFLKEHYILILAVLLVIPAIAPLFHKGFFTMHDDQQVVRLYEMDQALAAGQFPARWIANLGFGFGYPLFIFYPPLYLLSWRNISPITWPNFHNIGKNGFYFCFFGRCIFNVFLG